MEFKGTKGKWEFVKYQEASFERVVITDEEGNWIFNSDHRSCIDTEEEANFLIASKSKEMLEMLEIILKCCEKGIHLKHHDLNNIKTLIKQAKEL